MKLKTSITIITGCLVIFLFIMLPVFLSMEKKKDEIESKFEGSDFSLLDVNNKTITEPSKKLNIGDKISFENIVHEINIKPSKIHINIIYMYLGASIRAKSDSVCRKQLTCVCPTNFCKASVNNPICSGSAARSDLVLLS